MYAFDLANTSRRNESDSITKSTKFSRVSKHTGGGFTSSEFRVKKLEQH